MKFFDVNTFIGMPTCRMYGALKDAEGLLASMKVSGISEAVVWHISQQDGFPLDGNLLLSEEIRGKKCLCGCWTILPPQTREVVSKGFFKRMKKDGIFFLRAFPAKHNYLLNAAVFGDFFEELSERKVPLMLSLERGVSWDNIYSLMSEFPKLTCIVCDIGVWGQDRRLWPLLEKYRNLMVETSLLSLGEFMLEATVEEFGAERIVFGTGFPSHAHQAAMLQLVHAEISEKDKQKIASRNIERVIGRISL